MKPGIEPATPGLQETPRLNDNIFILMYNESKRLNIDTHGGLILDEMAVQEDLKWDSRIEPTESMV